MIEFFDAAPTVSVETSEYVRLLGYPRGHALDGRARELVEWARDWYAAHGRPWVYARQARHVEIASNRVTIDGVDLHSGRLERTLRDAGAHSVVLVAVSAGAGVEREAHEAWLAERPDEYFFLEMYGSAVVEHLVTMTGARLCGWADGESMAVLPHDSPGYPDWDISEQARVFSLLDCDDLPGPLEVLESGMLRPKKSLLAAFGITRHVDRVRRLTNLSPCERCSYANCQFRRVPYGRTTAGLTPRPSADSEAPAVAASYVTSVKALRLWAADRLTLDWGVDGSVEAVFRYDGTTCSNMGRRLSFLYRVTLGPREAGFPLRSLSCHPAPGDDGYQFMCEYVREGDDLLDTIAHETPLVGQPLDAVLAWDRPTLGAGCHCEPAARLHKWGLALETIHFALTAPDRGAPTSGRASADEGPHDE